MALHFATVDWPHSGTDGAVWTLDFAKVKARLPKRLKSALNRRGVNVFTTTELAAIVPSLAKLRTFEEKGKGPFLVLFEPPSLDDRIVNQYAALSVLSRADKTPHDWLAEDGSVCQKIIIPRSLKATIRERLDMMNMTERVLYPGLDGLTAWLKRYYGPPWPNPSEPRPVYAGQYVNLFRSTTGWEYLRRTSNGNGVGIIAITREKRLILVEQVRQPFGKNVIELPAGVIELNSNARSTARHELRQETGYTCEDLVFLCDGAPSPGLVHETNTIYRATGLKRKSKTTNDRKLAGIIQHGIIYGRADEGERITAWEVPIDQVTAWLDQRRDDGAIIDLRIYAGLAFVQRATTASATAKPAR